MLTGVRRQIGQAARQPLVQFLVLGAVFYGFYAWIGGGGEGEEDRVIRVTVADVSRLDAGWQARYNRPPTQQELAGLVREYVREIALYRHAVAMGLDKNDPVIRRTLGQKLQTLTQNLVELSLSPSDQELASYFQANAERYRPPELITLTQVFVDPDKRGDTTLTDAEEILAGLRDRGEPGEGLEKVGDPFMLQRYYPRKAQGEIAKQFGRGFAESAFGLGPGEWHGPVLSGYGVHLVYVHALEDAPLPELSEVQEQVKRDWIDERRLELQEKYIDEVLSQYEIVFEELPAEGEEPQTEARAETRR
jgi:hypothetical protein